jgi:ubiquinone/menaquinone biosynthesis C-methylase UbiE
MIMRNLSYYEAAAPFYDTVVPRDIKGVCDSVEKIIKKYNKRKKFLDLGCGTGRFTIELAKRGYSMTGLDITSEILEVAQRNAKKVKVKVKFIKGNILNFKLKKRLGVIWARGSIGDLINISDVKRAFRNIRNNLSKKGIFVFDVRDFSYYMKKFKDGFRSENRVFKQRNKVMTFNFSAKLDKKTKIERMKGEIVVKTGKNIKKYIVNHILRYHTRKGVTSLLNNAGFNVLEIQQGGYRLDKKKNWL